MAQRQKRFTHDRGISLCGRPGEVGKNEGSGDPLTEEYNISIPLIASAAEQTIDLPLLPSKGFIIQSILNTITPSTAGSAQTIDIGITGNSTGLFSAAVTNGTVPLLGVGALATAGEQLVYTFGSADIDVYESELFLRVIDFGS